MKRHGLIIEVPIPNDRGGVSGHVKWHADSELVPTDNGVCPREFETFVDGGIEHASVRIRAVLDRQPALLPEAKVVEVSYICPNENVTPETAMSAYDYDSLLSLAWIGRRVATEHIGVNPDGTSTIAMHRVMAGRKRIDSPRPNFGKRPRMTEERLLRVAEIYTRNKENGLKAVERAFQVSQATAARYVKQAREAGLIEDRRRNKSS